MDGPGKLDPHREFERTMWFRAWELRPDEWRFWTHPDFGPTPELFSFLDYFGTDEEVEIRRNAVLTLLYSLERTGLDDEEKRPIYEALQKLGRHLDELAETSRTIADVLAERGERFERSAESWRYEVRVPHDGASYQAIPPAKLKAILPPGIANRPAELFNREVAHLCDLWKIRENTAQNRQRIADGLNQIFPPRQLDPRSRGPLWEAVNTYLKPYRRKTPPKSPNGA